MSKKHTCTVHFKAGRISNPNVRSPCALHPNSLERVYYIISACAVVSLFYKGFTV